jgi:ribosomal protein L37AE/L43A
MTVDLPRSHVCAVCCSPIAEDRYETGAWCCSRRCERVHDRIGAARASGDEGKLDRALAVKGEVLRESLAASLARADARDAARVHLD